MAWKEVFCFVSLKKFLVNIPGPPIGITDPFGGLLVAHLWENAIVSQGRAEDLQVIEKYVALFA